MSLPVPAAAPAVSLAYQICQTCRVLTPMKGSFKRLPVYVCSLCNCHTGVPGVFAGLHCCCCCLHGCHLLLLPLPLLLLLLLLPSAAAGVGRTISSLQDMEAAAQHLHGWGCQTVLIKGGHLAERQQQQQQGTAAQVVDVLYDGQQFHYFTAPYINTSNAHGTGCTLGAAIATALAAGYSPVEAVAAAKGYLTATLAASSGLHLGQGPQHPFHHGSGLSSVTGLRNPVEARAAAGQGLGRHRLNPVDLRVYVVTDPGCNAKAGRSLMQAVEGAVAGGATVVQLREKDIDGGDFLKEARAIVEVRVGWASRNGVLKGSVTGVKKSGNF